MADSNICIFGEVLFDHFPDGSRVLGGAPFNVAWHLQAFAQSPCFISRVGDDAEGQDIINAMRQWGMQNDQLQIDSELPTGSVDVTLHDDEPSYDIVNPSAYDAITPAFNNLHCQLLYHGSLALREETSRESFIQLTKCKPEAVFFDLNLRAPWWQKEHLAELVAGADWVKLNDDELNIFYPTKNIPALIQEYSLQGVVLTHGGSGAEIITRDGNCTRVVPDTNTTVVDTVGAGDAFTSVIILGLVSGWDMETTARRAQSFASSIVSRRGAIVTDINFYRGFINSWHLASA